MNSRWFLVQVTTSKRVIMENEREKRLLKELEKIQDQKPRGDSLLKLIQKLQRRQAFRATAKTAASLSEDRVVVARAVVKFLRDTDLASGSGSRARPWTFVCDSCGNTEEPCECVAKYLSKGNLSWCHATKSE